MNGVFYRPDRKKWVAMLNHDKQRIHLGQFDTQEEAQSARDRAVKRFEEAKKQSLERSANAPQPSEESSKLTSEESTSEDDRR